MIGDPVRRALPLSDTAVSAVAPHTPSVASDGKRRNPYIQWLRAVAALLVMLYHTATYQNLRLHDGRFVPIFGDWCGFFGVALFFAISGYLMSIAVRVQPAGLFLMHRVARIYPLYIVVGLAFLGLSAAMGLSAAYQPLLFLLMPERISKPILGIEWTLVYEISFYAMLYLASLLRLAKRIEWLAIAWILAIAGVAVIWPDDGTRVFQPLYRLLFMTTSLPMAAGLLVPWLARRRVAFGGLFVAAALPWFAVPFADSSFDALRVLYGLSAVFLVWAVVTATQAARTIHLGALGRMMARLGDHSYALYLCHKPVIELLYARPTGFSPMTVAGLAIAVSLGLASLAGRADVALYARLKRWLAACSSLALARAAALYAVLFALAAGQGAVAYYRHDRLDNEARRLAVSIARNGAVDSADQASVAARQAGFAPSDTIEGAVERFGRVPSEGRTILDFWGVNRIDPRRPVYASVFRAGKLVVSLVPGFSEAGVAARNGVKAKTGFHYEVVEPCEAAPVIVVLYTADKRFTVLPTASQKPACPG